MLNDSPALELNESATIPSLVPARKSNSRVATQVTQLRFIQQGLYQDFQDNAGKPAVRALLARTYTIVTECLRVARGIPSPGQLRPDLDPVQMARMLKRAKSRQSIDLPSDIRAALKSAKGKSWAEEPSNEALPQAEAKELDKG